MAKATNNDKLCEQVVQAAESTAAEVAAMQDKLDYVESQSGNVEKYCDDSELKSAIGRTEFVLAPNLSRDKFLFIIKAEKLIKAAIYRNRYTCAEVLEDGKSYRFFYTEEDGDTVIQSYMPYSDGEDAGTDDIFDRETVIGRIRRRLFSYECSVKERGIKIALELKGKISFFAFGENCMKFEFREGLRKYNCVIDMDMTVTKQAREFYKSFIGSAGGADGGAGLYSADGGSDEYALEGILVKRTIYVYNCFKLIKKSAAKNTELTDCVPAEEATAPCDADAEIMRKLEGFSGEMKREITEFIKNKTKHPCVDKSKISLFTSVHDLRQKYAICREYYPVDVQRAIEKVSEDKSIRETQKASILSVLVNTPWGVKHNLNTDVKALKEGLDETHFGQEHLKNELIKLIVSNTSKKHATGTRILLVGSPGVGKTSLVRRFAQLYNIPFGKISLNGIETPYFLKGTPRLYGNAIVGGIMRRVHELGDNCMILLDEVDKMTSGGDEGNPYSALYDLLDTEELFRDNMIESGIDLSNIIFILTANDVAEVPPAILDRVEVICVDDYSPEEKYQITKNHVIPKTMGLYGLKKTDVRWSDKVIRELSERYTVSNGVRDIEKNILRVVRSIVVSHPDGKATVNEKSIRTFLDIKPCDCARIERDIAGLKNKYRYFKTSYAPATRERISRLFNEYDAAGNSEKEIIRKRLFCLVNILPTGKAPDFDIAAIKTRLDQTHYGMEKVKEQILMHLAARKYANQSFVKCILLNGMSGMGKTTICKTLADALNMPFVKISLNGITSPENINGFEATWNHAEPGIITGKLAELGTNTAFILLDEIDKMSRAEKDPYSALLDLLDNAGGFRDVFCDCAIDVSEAFIVATSNYIENIPAAVIDRMDIIEVGGYTEREKIDITKNCIIPKKLSLYNLTGKLSFPGEVVLYMVKEYCNSYGMRDVEKAVEKILCKLLAENAVTDGMTVDRGLVSDILGAAPTVRDNLTSTPRPGVARALAVSGNMGTTFAVEVTENPYADTDEITGLPGQSTIDSIKISKLLVSKYLKQPLPKIHIHLAEGGIEKDGPSAGITVFSAILSYFLDIPIDSRVGFTGEINVYGDVFAIGGAELKLAAAVSAGCSKVFIPYDNYVRLAAEGEADKYDCEIIAVKNVEEIIDNLFSCEGLTKI